MTFPKILYRAAIVCGLLPLITGIAIFLLWILTRWEWLPFAGFVTILGGIGLVMIGGLCLIIYVLAAWHSEPKAQIRDRFFTGTGVLISNFIVSPAIVFAVGYFPSPPRVLVTVTNEGPELKHFVVSAGGTETDLGTIGSGATIQKKIDVRESGELKFHALRDGQEIKDGIDNFVSPTSKTRFSITFPPEGNWSVTKMILVL